ncbi:hypothetical protein KHQ81_00875 [Mycoplasmatota bacterium]|nr:hypothetical protein KHQ81_00875 [Mycoplasmatota bacterium]
MRIKVNKEYLSKYYVEDHKFFTYVGQNSIIHFYDTEVTDFNDVYKNQEIDVQTSGSEYYVLIKKSYFDYTLSENKSALEEFERILNYNKGIAGYFFYLFPFIIYVWQFNFLPGLCSSFILYRLPFVLQVLGVIFIYFIFYGVPIYLFLKLRKSRIQAVWFGKYILQNIKNKEYRLKREEIVNPKVKKVNFWHQRLFGFVGFFFHHFGKKVAFMYIAFISFFVIIIGIFFQMCDEPIDYLPVLTRELWLSDFDRLRFIKTKYEFEEIIYDLEVETNVERCGEYICNFGSNSKLYDRDFNEIELEVYLGDTEKFYRLVGAGEGKAVISYRLENKRMANYKIIDLVNEKVIINIDNSYLNLNADDLIFFTKCEMFNGSIYLVGSQYIDEERNGIIYRINESEDTQIYTSTNDFLSSMAIKSDAIIISEIQRKITENPIIKELDLDLNVIKQTVLNDNHVLYSWVVQNEVIFLDYKGSIYKYFKMNEDFEVEYLYTYVLDAFQLHFFEDTIIQGYSLTSFTEFDNEFNKVNKGLECFGCSDEEYFAFYNFILVDDKLYAVNNDRVIKFTLTDDYDYSILRGTITNIGFIVFLSILIIPSTISYLVLNKRQKSVDSILNYFNYQKKLN